MRESWQKKYDFYYLKANDILLTLPGYLRVVNRLCFEWGFAAAFAPDRKARNFYYGKIVSYLTALKDMRLITPSEFSILKRYFSLFIGYERAVKNGGDKHILPDPVFDSDWPSEFSSKTYFRLDHFYDWALNDMIDVCKWRESFYKTKGGSNDT